MAATYSSASPDPVELHEAHDEYSRLMAAMTQTSPYSGIPADEMKRYREGLGPSTGVAFDHFTQPAPRASSTPSFTLGSGTEDRYSNRLEDVTPLASASWDSPVSAPAAVAVGSVDRRRSASDAGRFDSYMQQAEATLQQARSGSTQGQGQETSRTEFAVSPTSRRPRPSGERSQTANGMDYFRTTSIPSSSASRSRGTRIVRLDVTPQKSSSALDAVLQQERAKEYLRQSSSGRRVSLSSFQLEPQVTQRRPTSAEPTSAHQPAADPTSSPPPQLKRQQSMPIGPLPPMSFGKPVDISSLPPIQYDSNTPSPSRSRSTSVKQQAKTSQSRDLSGFTAEAVEHELNSRLLTPAAPLDVPKRHFRPATPTPGDSDAELVKLNVLDSASFSPERDSHAVQDTEPKLENSTFAFREESVPFHADAQPPARRVQSILQDDDEDDDYLSYQPAPSIQRQFTGTPPPRLPPSHQREDSVGSRSSSQVAMTIISGQKLQSCPSRFATQTPPSETRPTTNDAAGVVKSPVTSSLVERHQALERRSAATSPVPSGHHQQSLGSTKVIVTLKLVPEKVDEWNEGSCFSCGLDFGICGFPVRNFCPRCGTHLVL